MKKVLFVTSEAVPFIKTGGLADVTGSLQKYFDKKKYDVRIMIPKYLCIEEKLTGRFGKIWEIFRYLSDGVSSMSEYFTRLSKGLLTIL